MSCVCYHFIYPFSCSFSNPFNYPLSCSFLASTHGLVTVVIVKTINKECIMKAGAELCQAQLSWGWSIINNWVPDFGLTTTTCPPLHHAQRWLQSNTNFTFHALPSSILKLEISCQKENWCQGHSHTSWPIGFLPRMHARAGSRAFCFDCFFHNLVNFLTFSFFSGSKTTRNFYQEECI